MLNKLLLFFLKLLMAVLFFLVITPIGLILKIIGVDYLRLKKNKNSVTYWQRKK
jgi:hypothetical protein